LSTLENEIKGSLIENIYVSSTPRNDICGPEEWVQFPIQGVLQSVEEIASSGKLIAIRRG